MAMSSKRRTLGSLPSNGMAEFSIVTKTLTEHGFFSNKFFSTTTGREDFPRYVACGWQRVY